MAQATVEFQKLLNLERERHLREEEEELEREIEATEIPFSFPLEKTMKELNQNIFSDDKAIKRYNNSKVKARNFLTNVSYNRITAADFKNKNFVIDCFTFMILYLNPFYLERKFETVIERDFVNVLWTFLIPSKLYSHISRDDNVKTLNKIKVKYQDAKDIMIAFSHDPTNGIVLSDFLEKNAILYQFVFGNLFPKCFARINDYGINAKTLFSSYYHNFKTQKNIINWQKKKEEEEKVDYNVSPINMTTLNDDDDHDDENKENINPKKEKEEEKEEKKEEKKSKRKIKNDEVKKQKREAKKQRLLEQLNENTEKIKKLRKKQ